MANRQATRFLHTSSKRWRLIRERVLVRDMYLCKACGKYGNHVDHIDSNTANNHLSNLQTLCQPCHAVKTATEQAGGTWEPKGCNIDGTPFGGHWAKET